MGDRGVRGSRRVLMVLMKANAMDDKHMDRKKKLNKEDEGGATVTSTTMKRQWTASVEAICNEECTDG